MNYPTEYAILVQKKWRKKTCDNGQHPYAIIVACSDSRVIPESIFIAGIGDLFVIRVPLLMRDKEVKEV